MLAKMLIKEILKTFPINKTEAEIILADLLGKDRSFLHAYPEFNLTRPQEHRYIELLRRRESNEPLAYILGHKEFYGREFYVDRRVLIPRTETEDLVDQIISYIKSNYSIKRLIKIADVGTGSGCIAITLARLLPNAKIYATDIDQSALEVAKKNAKYHQVEDKIIFLEGDLLSPLSESVDIIVANLPYIKSAVIKKLDPQISKWEPKIALDGGADGLALYRVLFKQAEKVLKPNGMIFYELNGKVFKF